MVSLRGSLVAIVTPMSGGTAIDSPIDWNAFERLIEYHIDNGTDGLVVVGTTGESATLTEHEHCETIARLVRYVDGRVPVVAGTGANSTHEAIRLTRCALDSGADACLLVTPYYNKPTQEGLYQHFTTVAEAVSIPQILYNVPGRTACDMRVDTVIRLASVPNIIGIKEATGEVERVARLRAACGSEFLLLSGDDATGREFMLAGGDGVISVTANVAPAAMKALCEAALAGNASEAARIDADLADLHRDLFCEANPIPVKWGVWAQGLIDTGMRLPLTWLAEEYHPRVRTALERAGLAVVQP